MSEGFGFVYCATGQRYVEEAIRSIKSLIEVEPDTSITVFTDQDSAPQFDEPFGKRVDLVVLSEPSFSYNDKITTMQQSPYEKNLFLDTDTIIVQPLASQIGLALEFTDVLAQPNMGFNLEWESDEFSNCVGQFNTGVIGFRNNEAVQEMFRLWRELREERPESHDQPTFRAALFKSRAKYLPLTNQYNFHGLATLASTSPVAVVHLISQRMRQLAQDETAFKQELARIREHRFLSLNHVNEGGLLLLNGRWRVWLLIRIVVRELIERSKIVVLYRYSGIPQLLRFVRKTWRSIKKRLFRKKR